MINNLFLVGKRINSVEAVRDNRAEVCREFAMENTRRHPLHHLARKFNGAKRSERGTRLSDAKKEVLSLGLED